MIDINRTPELPPGNEHLLPEHAHDAVFEQLGAVARGDVKYLLGLPPSAPKKYTKLTPPEKLEEYGS